MRKSIEIWSVNKYITIAGTSDNIGTEFIALGPVQCIFYCDSENGNSLLICTAFLWALRRAATERRGVFIRFPIRDGVNYMRMYNEAGVGLSRQRAQSLPVGATQ